jgi:undecaprenyl-diphosphatase
MQFLQSIVLGIVQGLTEFIPVSSSAHLVIVPWLFGWNDPVFLSLGFDVALHMGTLLALLVFFWKDWVRLVSAWFKSIGQLKVGADPDRRMAWFVVLASIPGGIAGVLFEGKIDKLFHPERSPILASSMIAMAAIIAVLGALLFLADRLAKHERSEASIGWKDALLIGLAQALAIFPGVSRSGSTITAGLALGLDRKSAARFSFFLSAPIIAGAGLKSLFDLLRSHGASGSSGSAGLGIVLIGFLAAALTGYFCVRILMNFLQKHSTRAFAFYRWALAILVIVVALVRG